MRDLDVILYGATGFVGRLTAGYLAKHAPEGGARIVHACGFDSIPSDLGVLALHRAAAADGDGALADVTLVMTAKGGFSGGTLDSMRGQLDEARADRARARAMMDPYALSPDRDAEPDLGS